MGASQTIFQYFLMMTCFWFQVWRENETVILTIIAVVINMVTYAFILNYCVVAEKAQKHRDEQIDIIFKRCNYQKMMDSMRMLMVIRR